MANPLLDSASPKELADRAQIIETKGKVADFGRLVEIVEADLAEISPGARPAEWRALPVEIKLAFAWADDRGNVPAMSGRVSARLPGLCQRCLEPFEFPLETEINMLLLKPASELDDDRTGDVWEVEEGTVRPLDIVEESLVMALPLAPVHEAIEQCGSLIEVLSGENANGSTDVDRPFADLRAQMDKSN